jgi:hypothetical protein
MMAQEQSGDVPLVRLLLGPDEVNVWLVNLDVPERCARMKDGAIGPEGSRYTWRPMDTLM